MIPDLILGHDADMPRLGDEAAAVVVTADMKRLYASDAEIATSLEVGLVTVEDRRMRLSFLMTSDPLRRRKGIASRFLIALCASADRHGVVIEGQALALSLRDGRGVLKQDDLLSFYERHGFDAMDGDIFGIRRLPRPAEAP